MRHLAFYRALAKCPDDVCDAWRMTSAGLLVLRYFDWWLTDGPMIGGDRTAATRLQQALAELPRHARQARRLLQQTVERLNTTPNDDPTVVIGPLMAYGRYLEDTQQELLAADVFGSITEAMMPIGAARDPHGAAVAFLRLANVQRRQGALDDAALAYDRAIELAAAAQHLPLTITIHTWRAGLWRDLGNLGVADVEYTRLLSLAEHYPYLRSLILRGRGATRQRRGEADAAIRDLYEAFTLATSHADREVILGDLASCAAESGLRDLARDIHESLATHAFGHVARGYALANCFEHAIVDGDEPRYHSVRQRLRTQCDFSALPAELELYVAYLSARGLEQFGARDVALSAYEAVATHAHQAKRHHIEHDALARMAALRDGAATRAAAPTARELPASLADIAAIAISLGGMLSSSGIT